MFVFFCSYGVGHAGYEFDDLMGNGYTSQWVVLNDVDQTYGGNYDEAVSVSSDVLSSSPNNAVVNILSGKSDEVISSSVPRLLFLVLAEGYGEFYMNFKAEDLSFDVSTPNLGFNTIVNDNNITYVDTKEPQGSPEDLGAEWQQYKFAIARNGNQNTYDTVVQPFYFHQNPNKIASQTIEVPFLISNVNKGTAKDEPLIIRNTLRDSRSKNGNIVAYNRDTWDMTGDKSATNNQSQWVFVPDTTFIVDNDNRYFYLTTEVANHTSVRYKQSENFGAFTTEPDYWKFDIKRRQGMNYIPENFNLAATSHIAPGLVTVFNRRYDVNEQNKTPLRLAPVNSSYGGGPYDFTLNHKLISGISLGDVTKKASRGNFNLFEITAFRPGTISQYFYDNVKTITNAKGTVEPPASMSFNSSAVKQDENTRGIKTLTNFFTVEQNISGSSSEVERLLPLHITFNIPITLIDDSEWLTELIQQWYDTGDITDMFANKYEIFLLTENDGELNPWNLTQQLQTYGVANSQIKVFYDEERGINTQDNSKALITVSFIAMLMDGTRDGVRPELSIVEDHAISQENDYIVIRDGNKDNKWKMTFFVAPAGFKDNTTTSSANGNENGDKNLGDSSSGTCNTGLYASAALMAILFVMKKKPFHR